MSGRRCRRQKGANAALDTEKTDIDKDENALSFSCRGLQRCRLAPRFQLSGNQLYNARRASGEMVSNAFLGVYSGGFSGSTSLRTGTGVLRLCIPRPRQGSKARSYILPDCGTKHDTLRSFALYHRSGIPANDAVPQVILPIIGKNRLFPQNSAVWIGDADFSLLSIIRVNTHRCSQRDGNACAREKAAGIRGRRRRTSCAAAYLSAPLS